MLLLQVNALFVGKLIGVGTPCLEGRIEACSMRCNAPLRVCSHDTVAPASQYGVPYVTTPSIQHWMAETFLPSRASAQCTLLHDPRMYQAYPRQVKAAKCQASSVGGEDLPTEPDHPVLFMAG